MHLYISTRFAIHLYNIHIGEFILSHLMLSFNVLLRFLITEFHIRHDIEFSVDSNLQFRSARVMIACGGPNIYINSRSGSVDLYWWEDEEHWYLSPDCKTAVQNYFEELYQMTQ